MDPKGVFYPVDDDGGLRSLTPWVWTGTEGDSPIKALFHFSNHLQALDFVVQVAELAEREHHHPKIIFEYKSVELRWFTNDTQSIESLDYRCAQHCSDLYNQLQSL